MRILLNGARGRLGSEIASILNETGAAVTPLDKPEAGRSAEILAEGQEDFVFVDVSLPEGTLHWVASLREAPRSVRERCRGVLIGTTGFDAAGLASLAGLEGIAPWCLVSNFSAGVFLFEEMLRARTASGVTVAELARELGFDLAVWESHHTKKLDAPSGTAKTLAEAAGVPEERVASTRVGSVVGEHVMYLAADSEELRIQHIAHTRRLFARGAVAMARRMSAHRLERRRHTKAEILSLKDA